MRIVEGVGLDDDVMEWFRGSTVHDDGKPYIVHHFTYDDFNPTEYDRLHMVKTRGRKVSVDTVGMWFTDNPKVPYVNPEWGGRRMDCIIRITRPFYIDDIEEPNGQTHRDGESLVQLMKMATEAGGPEQLRDSLIQQGHDGIVMLDTKLDGRRQNVFVVFDPASQVRHVATRALPNGYHRPDSPSVIDLNEDTYQGEHAAPDAENGAPLHDLTRNGIYPEDVYGPEGFRHYANTGERAASESYALAMGYRRSPNRVVRVFRAVPKSVERAAINPGDWVAVSRRYAVEHGRDNLRKDYRVISKVVHARDVFTDGGSLCEWGYDPQPYDREADAEKRRRRAERANT